MQRLYRDTRGVGLPGIADFVGSPCEKNNRPLSSVRRRIFLLVKIYLT